MTEQEWLECTDSTPMLEFLRESEKEKEKQLRQFAFGCCYRTWHLLPSEGQQLLEVMDQFSEGNATRHERDAAVAAFRAVHGRYGADTPILRAAYRCKDMAIDAFTADIVAGNTAVTVGNSTNGTARSATYAAAYAAERAGQVALLRCIFGNPFWTVTMNLAWLAWNDGTICRIAQAIYAERAFDRLPILADALEDAGCVDENLLRHCRSEGPHVRGCWVLDLLLGKT